MLEVQDPLYKFGPNRISSAIISGGIAAKLGTGTGGNLTRTRTVYSNMMPQIHL